MEAVRKLLEAYDQGNSVLFSDGRSFADLDLGAADDDAAPPIWTLEYGLETSLRERYGMFMLRVSLSGGLDWGESTIVDQRDRRTILTILRAHGLPTRSISEEERQLDRDQPTARGPAGTRGPIVPDVTSILRGLASLVRTDLTGELWADGQQMRVAVLVEYVEHLAPAHTAGSLTEQERVAAEVLSSLAQSLAARKSRNLLIMQGRYGRVNDLVTGAAHHVELLLPDAESKLAYARALHQRYPNARLEDGLTLEALAHAMSATPNRGLDPRFFASHHQAQLITMHEMMAQKAIDIAEISENTLQLLDPSRVRNVQLVGRNIAVPAAELMDYARRLARGARNTPLNVLLAGSPGSAKTDLATLAASGAGVAALEMLSPKNPFVGESDRLARLQHRVMNRSGKIIGWADEVTQSFKMSRHEGDADTDSGASRAVQGEWLKALSDESRRGRVMIIAATNTPWEISLAMRSRFVVIPVLRPLREDLPAIVLSLARRVTEDPELQLDDAALADASAMFDDKGATPRTISAALAKFSGGETPFTVDTLVSAARDVAPEVDRVSGAYADLWAIRHCSFLSFLPWFAEPATYPYPPYIADLVDRTTGQVDYSALDSQIERYRADAHV